MSNKYFGCKNYETWNVAYSIIENDNLYKQREAYKDNTDITYKKFIHYNEIDGLTPHGVAWLNDELDYEYLDSFIKGREHQIDNGLDGWKNYETFYIMDLIKNEYYHLYLLKTEYSNKANPTYNGFRKYAELAGLAGKGIMWDDDRLDYDALDEFIRDEY